ncbi:MAG: Hsp33 family molecular chaperone HslO [Planctomycetes bacterium]|nr:Hsp33 family molecular chaperone HslO [Planctomycetota bacterium]
MSEPAIDSQSDHVLRAMTDDGAFRVMTIRCTQTVRDAANAQEAVGHAAAELGEMIVSSILVRETMAPAFRVQVAMRDEDGNQIVGDSFPEGKTRGLVRVKDNALGVRLHRTGFLQVSRSLPGRPPHEGVVSIQPDEGVEAALTDYFQQSEQVETMVGIACLTEGEDVVAAGGYVVQLLPELTEPPLAAMRKRLAEFGPLAPHLSGGSGDPQSLMDGILGGTEYTRLHDSSVTFACICGTEKAMSALSALGRAEVQELLDAGDEIGVTCDYCRTRYSLGPTEFRRVLDAIPPEPGD